MRRVAQQALLAALAFSSILVADGFAPPSSRLLRNAVSTSRQHATVDKEMVEGAVEAVLAEAEKASEPSSANFQFKTVMAANRAEIAVRIMRAAVELNAATVGIYVHEDRYSQHRWGADRSFMVEKKEGATPISAYLDIAQIIEIAQENNVDAIHPGYGFLSESPEFAQACADAGITFVGPTVDNLLRFSDKTSARQAAIEAGVPVVPGSDGPLTTNEEVVEFVQGIGLPIIIKVSCFGRS
jgi:pyruvate carboxylase